MPGLSDKNIEGAEAKQAEVTYEELAAIEEDFDDVEIEISKFE
jgi:hypothetical protein